MNRYSHVRAWRLRERMAARRRRFPMATPRVQP